jgi:hypothetical protein
MTCDEARQFLWREPFQPVRIRLKDGRAFCIPNPRWAMAAEAILIIGTPPADDPTSRLPDRGIWVQWPEVDAIEPLSEQTAPTV